VGRFAPSPTGPLHLGSLVAAVASYLQAKTHGGRWIVRVEDIDPPREQPGATEDILQTLRDFGFIWDEEPGLQSRSRPAHESALQTLIDAELAYPCGCSRRQLVGAPRGPLGTIYPGTCRDGCSSTETAIRIRTTDQLVAFDDGLQGRVGQHLESESGDFIIRRRDGLIAYHLAVVVDDELQGITEILRGIDLMDSTPRQIWLQRLLGYRTPNYLHIPVITHANGDKLSKLTGAPGIRADDAPAMLVAALRGLRQEPPANLGQAALEEIWAWAIENWHIESLCGVKAIPVHECLDSNPSNGLA